MQSTLRSQLRSHQGENVTVKTTDGRTINGVLHDAGPKTVWFVVPATDKTDALDEILRYELIEAVVTPL